MSNRISILGAGAFGTALALVYSRDGRDVLLVGRDQKNAAQMRSSRVTTGRLSGHRIPDSLDITADPSTISADDVILLAVPTQSLGSATEQLAKDARLVVACCKGIDLATRNGPTGVIAGLRPSATVAVMTGPSFAADLAVGMPTALTLATQNINACEALQETLSTPTLRLYRTTDVIGAEIGGALKNVVALAAGITIGAGLGDSARAAVIARGFAEMSRFATNRGASAETLAGLSGLGDLVLTCTSEKSRNFAAGIVIGGGGQPDPNTTVEGLATATALADISAQEDIEMPLSLSVHAIASGKVSVADGIDRLLRRPLKPENT